MLLAAENCFFLSDLARDIKKAHQVAARQSRHEIKKEMENGANGLA